mmetsp:Transcript_425/g.1400  ORF Transcript_425/g.1400 Transcript_425/m.1400 type:complete len:217 (+) Transcript_425:85-735(+)
MGFRFAGWTLRSSSAEPSAQGRRTALPTLARAPPAGHSGATRAARILSRSTSGLSPTRTGTCVPGHGVNARTLSAARRAAERPSSPGPPRSSAPSSLVSFGASVARSPSCATHSSVPSQSPGMTSSTSSCAPTPKSSSSSAAQSSPSSTARVRCAATGPASIFSTVRSTVTPTSASPASRDRWSGAAPRQRGSRLGCTFIVPCFGIARNAFGRNWP